MYPCTDRLSTALNIQQDVTRQDDALCLYMVNPWNLIMPSC